MEKRKPRVILVGGLPRPSGGVTVFLGRLVRALGDQIDFHILDINAGEKEPNKAITHRVMPTQRLLRVIMIAVFSVILPADIIHYHYSRPLSLLTLFATPFLNKRIHMTLHNGALIERVLDIPALLKWALKISLRRVDKVYVLSEGQEEFYRYMGVPEQKYVYAKSHILPPNVSPDFVDAEHAALAARSNQVVVASGHLDRIYNYEFFIRLLNETPHLGGLLFVYGVHLDMAYLSELKAGLDRPEQLQVYTSQSETTFLAALAASHAFLRPNHVDSWGISVADACYMKIPAIASDVCTRHSDAILFPAGDYEAFAKRTLKALEFPAEQGHSAIIDTAEEKLLLAYQNKS